MIIKHLRYILAGLVLCISNPAFSENWQKIGKENGKTLYIDADDIRKENGFIFYTELIDFDESIYGALSRISEFKLNCLKNEIANLSVTSYTGQMGKYIVINEAKNPGIRFFDSSTSTTAKYVCSRAN